MMPERGRLTCSLYTLGLSIPPIVPLTAGSGGGRARGSAVAVVGVLGTLGVGELMIADVEELCYSLCCGGFWVLKLVMARGWRSGGVRTAGLHFPSRDLNFGRDGDR